MSTPSPFPGAAAIRTLLLAGLLALASAQLLLAHENPVAEDMANAARNLLAALQPEQRAKATFEFKSDERENWHFIPTPRKGLSFNDMTPEQRHLAHGLLQTGLSQRGYLKATTIMSLEAILKDVEKGSGPVRDADLYFVSIFGEPNDHGTWAWRVEGHHLSLNFTLIDGDEIQVTPTFMGTNPAEVRQGPRKGLRVLAGEEDLGRELVKSLSADQQKAAIFADKAPSDIITGDKRHIDPLAPDGILASELNGDQRKVLLRLIREYVFRYRPELAEKDLAEIAKAGFEKIRFAWAGPVEPGNGHYYRLQGPTFLMEYDNTQNNANHIHTVWRDFKNDFGEDLLRKHYQDTPHAK